MTKQSELGERALELKRQNTVRRVLSPRECWQIAGCCKAIYQRELRPHLSLVRISPRRVGHWSDELYALLEARTERRAA